MFSLLFLSGSSYVGWSSGLELNRDFSPSKSSIAENKVMLVLLHLIHFAQLTFKLFSFIPWHFSDNIVDLFLIVWQCIHRMIPTKVGWKVSFVKFISFAPLHVLQIDASFLLSSTSSTLQPLHPSSYCGKVENIENMRVRHCGNCGDGCVIFSIIFCCQYDDLARWQAQWWIWMTTMHHVMETCTIVDLFHK